MTSENHLLFGLEDILTIKFRCTKCGATRGYPTRHWKEVPHKCTNCDHLLVHVGGLEEKALVNLGNALEALLKTEGLGCVIALEFNSPTDSKRSNT